jgi:hypothetical protein
MHVCTATDPWTPAKGERAQHPDAVEHPDTSPWWADVDRERYTCPHCGLTFDVTLPSH